MQRLATLALAILVTSTAAIAASRGPSTPEERQKLVTLVAQLEAEPLSEQATKARQWLLAFLQAVPDITAKQCASLVGAPAERQGVPSDLLMQQLYSNAAYVVQHQVAPGTTEALHAGLSGTLRAYQAMRAKDATPVHPRLEQLLEIERNGRLVEYVRAQGRVCR